MLLRSLFLLALLAPSAPPAYAQVVGEGGLKAEITAVTIPGDRRPVVTFKIADAKSRPLDVSDLDSNSVKFTIAALKTAKDGEREYRNYILTKVTGKDYVFRGETRKAAVAETLQPSADDGGTFRRLSPGAYTYTFKTALPTDFDRKATHVVGGELTRGERRYAANPLYEFVPGGGRVQARWELAETALCNRCHDPMRAHRGAARETGYCALCHTSQLSDPDSGESLDFKYFIHKLHRGKYLPSVKGGKPYFTVGLNQRVVDFSTIVSPQSVTTETIPKEYRNCYACHANPKVTFWKTLPSTVGCISCHDDVNLKTGQKHGPGPAADGSCVNCHAPDGPEFGPSVVGAHTFPGNASQLPGIVFDILKIEGGKPGTNPVVTFSLKDKKGAPVEASKMNNLGLVLAWPTVDYKTEVVEDARKAAPQGNGVHTYKFNYTIPADATGSGAVGIQGYRLFEVKRPSGTVVEKSQRDAGHNVVRYFPITDSAAVPRRTAVKTENCNVCHLKLQPHGEQRNNTEFCVMCHNANHTDEEKRKVAKGPMPPQNVHYKRFIHRIHTGRNLGEEFIVYGGPAASPVPVNLGEVRFPGDRRNCLKCHEKGANELPLPQGVIATALPQADGSVKQLPPIASACGGCHNKEPAQIHMEQQTAAGGRESCVVCHGVGREFAVAKMHQKGRD
ncbi:MAG TPA: OmcA/MtrC family decaheme c-type cytochrome [Verrucomicrobiae bacterium]|jgi:OmcA/MtrC family decaheme c-type cytochrome|nr:OmcA/MtrC family decaheme c-type cytochrome [Verrucomicrobiae bacterium]